MEVAFRNVTQRDHWANPSEGTAGRKNWVSKVDWDGADRINPESKMAVGYQNYELDKELRGEMEHQALLAKAAAALANNGPKIDRLNP